MSNRRRHIVCTAILALLVASPAAAYQLQAGIGFVAVTDSVEGTELVLEDALHAEVTRGFADRFGSLIFRELAQGASYFVREEPGGTPTPVTVLQFEDHPSPAFYQAQSIGEGLQYIQMRDGTLLAAMVRPPLSRTELEPGKKYPTLIEYSGYAAADPNNPQPSTLLASVLGYVTVGVNMRGSGCSGGVLDLFDYPTTADGYDVVEAIAAQPWVLGNRVGMIGISFPGISQTFVAGAQPPSLAAVAPFSVIADIYRAPGFPGGIFNNGFGQTWLQERKDDAEPAPEGGQAWAIQRVNEGDTTCLANQKLRLQTQDPVDFTY
jgi:predicted acyl esterase